MSRTLSNFRTYLKKQKRSSGEAKYKDSTIDQYLRCVESAANHSGVDVFSVSISELKKLVREFDTDGKYSELGIRGNRVVYNGLNRFLEYVISDEITNSYLLTWNPEKYQVGGDSGVELGVEKQWSCNSKQPQVGDRVYLMKVGIEPRGIIAAGIVTEESFEDKDWGDETQTRKYIKFKPLAVRNTPESGQLLLGELKQIANHLNIDFNWSPQSSGISIPNDIARKLESYWFDEISLVEETQMTESNTIKSSQPLNQILFGPPGTGKTYNTIERAVRAAEPEFTWNSRDELKAKYQDLIRHGRIRFVTFHQSFSYEDFVEGLTAHTDNGNLVYEKRLGIFRQIVKAAKEHRVSEVKDAATSFDECWEAFLSDLEDNPDGIDIKTRRSHFTVTEVDANTIRFDKSTGQSVHTLSATTLEAVFNGDREIKGGLQPYYESLVRRLKEIGKKLDNKKVERQNYILIIDEINRGNISRIFGELITLIEPSKRSGAPEALEVTLPLTGDRFSVPDNLYIIGTMNTADRSLAGLDLALRRRFDFIEMPPLPSTLANVFVDGINIEKLLEVINRRITALLDKDHCIGHAYFIHLSENASIDALAEVFKQKIIPLLQEYFFEDWQRIRWILNDQSKPNEHAFIVKDDSINFDELFPGDVQMNQRDRWRLNDEAFHSVNAYTQIYDIGSAE